jgi:hypothetical protein
MQRDEVLKFLGSIDRFLGMKFPEQLRSAPYPLSIIGKGALQLAGIEDSRGTVDLDSLVLDGVSLPAVQRMANQALIKEFSRDRLAVYGYYLEFVDPAIVFLSQAPKWVSVDQPFDQLAVRYLHPVDVVASKIFSGAMVRAQA